MSPRWIRRVVWLVFLGGIGGMIAGSIADNNGMAITFGLLTAVAAVGLILVSSVAPPGSFHKPEHDDASRGVRRENRGRRRGPHSGSSSRREPTRARCASSCSRPCAWAAARTRSAPTFDQHRPALVRVA